MSRSRPNPLLLVAFVLLAGATAQAQTCGNGIWSDGEFCGQDAYAVTGEADMNHDCVVDILDIALFAPQLGMTGAGISADLNTDGVVDLLDITFLATSLFSGNAVTPCNPTPGYPDSCGSNLSLSLDPTIIVSRGRAAALGLVAVHVIVDGWVDAETIEYGFTHSANLSHYGFTSPAGWSYALDSTAGNSRYYAWYGSALTGTSTVITHHFFLASTDSAWVELTDFSPSTGQLNRWAPSSLDRRTEFQVRRHVGINSIDPVCVTACGSANVSPTVTLIDPATDITLPYANSSYTVTGTASDSDGTLAFVEYRVDSGAWQTASGTTSWSFTIPLAIGENWVQVRTADTAGAYSQTSVVSINRNGLPDLRILSWAATDTLLHGCRWANVLLSVHNNSAYSSPSSRVGFYVSSDTTIDVTDHYVAATYISGLSPGDTASYSTGFEVKDDGPRGAVYLGGFVDDEELVDETYETNNKAVSPLEYPVPVVMSITDVGNDQGRVVRINIGASSRDVLGSPTPILQYEFFREINPLPAPKAIAEGPALGGNQVSDPAKLAGWEFVGAVPAHGESEYNAIVPTLADSTSAGVYWSVFMVRAATAQPLVYFDSCPKIGYSVDNLPPSVPAGLVVAYAAAGNRLSWDPNLEDDFRYYRVYRGAHLDFVPNETNLVKAVANNEWLDTATDPWAHHYKITAVDQAGNESPVAGPEDVSGALELPSAPARFALHQCVPNPFNPVTRIKYDLPEKVFVTLSIYAANGRLINTVVNEIVPAGVQEAEWDGTDRFGRRVAAGVYIYRIEAGAFNQTRRMVLVK